MIDISLIKNWHEKAKEDYFSRYTFEYLAFEAFLKKYKYTEQEIINCFGKVSERGYIQKIKNESVYYDKWKNLLLEDENLKETVLELVQYLKQEPLDYKKKWWSCSEFNCDNYFNANKGIINDENDFINVIEFWNYVRNNLFHAGKNPDDQRDKKLVTFAYKTLSVFFEKILLPEIENKTLSPAIWEDFEHRFFKGKAEVTLGKTEACANVYELLFIDEKYFPLVLRGKRMDKDYIISKLSFHLTSLWGEPTLLKAEWNKIIRNADTPEKKNELSTYFQGILPLLKEVIGDLELQK